MINALFVLALSALAAAYLYWGFRYLPGERWQILATIPIRVDSAGHWHGLNITYYGLLSSSAQMISVLIVFLLFAAAGVSRVETALLVVAIFAACLPASKWLAVWVEKRDDGLTVGGASFVGIVLAPWLVVLSNLTIGSVFESHIPVVPALAAMAIAYAFGEGFGRLACISFGCCYGKPLRSAHPMLQRVFRRWHFVFYGPMKKIVYAGKMGGEKVIPIQAITAVLYVLTGLVGLSLFLVGWYASALLLALAITQLWRVYSETWRADYRGEGSFSVYQKLAVLSILYTAATVALVWHHPAPAPALVAGFEALWHPGMILFLIVLWMVSFIFYGRSAATGSRLSLYVRNEHA